jgi:DNA polymerase-3 subunit beta
MEFSISKNALQKELGFVQGIVEKKNTIPVLSNILIESVGENTIRIIGTDLDVTIRCETDAEEIKVPGSICVQARKLFDISRLLPESTVNFKKEENDWVSVKCENFRSRVPGVPRETFPEVPSFKSAPTKLPAEVFKSFIDRTIFAITQEESRYQLSGAKFMLDKTGAKMVTTDGHRLAYIERRDLGKNASSEALDALIPRKTLAELTKLTTSFEGEISLGADENHIYFEVGPRLLISRRLAGQFPNYEMVMPKGIDKSVVFDTVQLNQAIRRVALMADDRSHAIRFHLIPNQLQITSQNAEEGEAGETMAADYTGDEAEIGFNAQYLQDFLNVLGEGQVAFEFKDGNSQAQLRPAVESEYDYKYIVMPMRI